MIEELTLNMIYCFIATCFFALIMNSPKKVIPISSFIASIGYMIYFICVNSNQTMIGFFLGTLIIALFGETCARLFKMPATIFIFPAIVPIVPGLGLYQTMLAFVQDDISSALEIGVGTILNIGAMAIAMALMSLVASKLPNNNKN